MSFQNTVRKTLAFGVVGEFYDTAPRVASTWIVNGAVAASTIAAKGILGFTANAVEGDTITVGATTYTLTATIADVPNTVLLGADIAATITNIVAAVMANGTEGTQYGTGTVANASATAAASGNAVVFTAKTAGPIGNSIELSASNGAGTSITPFAGGINATATALPTVARVFTLDSAPDQTANYGYACGNAKMGGTDEFLGVLVHPKAYVNWSYFSPSLELREGEIGELCVKGHIIVAVTAPVTIGAAAYYDPATGEIGPNGGTTTTAIPNGKFVLFNSDSAGMYAVLALNNA